MNQESELSPVRPSGTIYLVSTPIGNLEDITLRALRVLKEVDCIACEDTRRTQILLNHYGIKTPTISYHEHNEITRAPELIARLERGENLALVADAGTPVISDPGYRLVRLAIRRGIPLVPIPGPSALVAALTVAGLPVERFRFIGFLPSKKIARRKTLEHLKDAEETLIFYEAPHRLTGMLEAVLETLGGRPVVVAREMTKVHEEFVRGPASQTLAALKNRPVKGEITVLVAPPSEEEVKPSPRESLREEIGRLMAGRGLDERGALKALARERKISRSEAYRLWQTEKSLGK